MFDYVHSFSYRDLAPRERKHRSGLVFSPGAGVPLALYSGVAEALASQGLVIVGIDPPGGTGIVVYPDGSVKAFEPNAVPDETVHANWVKDIQFVQHFMAAGWRRLRLLAPVEAVLRQVDPERIGALGHSFGGSAAVQAAASTPAIRASANLDGRFFGDVAQSGTCSPVLVMLSEGHTAVDSIIAEFLEHTRCWAYTAEVSGASHDNFGDLSTLIPGLKDPTLDPAVFQVGSIDAARMQQIEAAYVRGFFDAYLAGKPSDFLIGESELYPEVSLGITAP